MSFKEAYVRTYFTDSTGQIDFGKYFDSLKNGWDPNRYKPVEPPPSLTNKTPIQPTPSYDPRMAEALKVNAAFDPRTGRIDAGKLIEMANAEQRTAGFGNNARQTAPTSSVATQTVGSVAGGASLTGSERLNGGFTSPRQLPPPSTNSIPSATPSTSTTVSNSVGGGMSRASAGGGLISTAASAVGGAVAGPLGRELAFNLGNALRVATGRQPRSREEFNARMDNWPTPADLLNGKLKGAAPNTNIPPGLQPRSGGNSVPGGRYNFPPTSAPIVFTAWLSTKTAHYDPHDNRRLTHRSSNDHFLYPAQGYGVPLSFEVVTESLEPWLDFPVTRLTFYFTWLDAATNQVNRFKMGYFDNNKATEIYNTAVRVNGEPYAAPTQAGDGRPGVREGWEPPPIPIGVIGSFPSPRPTVSPAPAGATRVNGATATQQGTEGATGTQGRTQTAPPPMPIPIPPPIPAPPPGLGDSRQQAPPPGLIDVRGGTRSGSEYQERRFREELQRQEQEYNRQMNGSQQRQQIDQRQQWKAPDTFTVGDRVTPNVVGKDGKITPGKIQEIEEKKEKKVAPDMSPAPRCQDSCIANLQLGQENKDKREELVTVTVDRFVTWNRLLGRPVYAQEPIQVPANMAPFVRMMGNRTADIRARHGLAELRAKLAQLLQIVNTVTTVHNAAMLSTSLAQTLGSLVTEGFQTFAPFFGMDKEVADQFDANEVLGKAIDETLKNLLGEQVWNGTKENWRKANRIISTASNIIWTVRSIGDSAREIGEFTAENTGKIGNALKKYGIVGERAYPYMPERVNSGSAWSIRMQRFRDGVENIDDAASSLSNAVSEVRSIRDEVDELKEQKKTFDESVKNAIPNSRPDNEPVKKSSSDSKQASTSPTINQSDESKPEN